MDTAGGQQQRRLHPTYSLSEHAKVRLAERCGLKHIDAEFRQVHSIIAASVSLFMDRRCRDNALFRLFYLRSTNSYCVLALLAIGSADTGYHHPIVTALDLEMYEERYGKVGQRKKIAAVRARMPLAEFNQWCVEHHGKLLSPGTGRLEVTYMPSMTGKTMVSVKVRPALCEQFKMYEPYEDTLAHPGALTRVHTALQHRGLRIEDRCSMSFSSPVGLIKLRAHEASVCPYCGAVPLETDKAAHGKDFAGVDFPL